MKFTQSNTQDSLGFNVVYSEPGYDDEPEVYGEQLYSPYYYYNDPPQMWTAMLTAINDRREHARKKYRSYKR